MTEGAQRFQIHLITVLGLVVLVALLVHLNFAPLVIDHGRNTIVIRYGWPLLIGEYEPKARFLFDIVVAIGLPILFYRVCEGCLEWIRWNAIASAGAPQRARAARMTLARLKAAIGRDTPMLHREARKD